MARAETIRRRFTRNILWVIVLLGGAILGATFLGNARTVETLSRSILRRAADQTQARLGRFFDPVVKQLEVAARWKARGLLAKDDPAAIDNLLVPVMRRSPQISSILIADERGREHMLLHTEGGWRNRVTRRDEEPDEVLLRTWTDRDPTVVERREADPYDPRLRPWFVGAVQLARQAPAGGPTLHWTEPYRFYTTKEPGITASVAVDKGEGYLHVLGVDVLLADISAFTTGPDLEVSEHGFVFVVDGQSRRVVGLPRTERFLDEEARRTSVNLTLDELQEPVLRAAWAAADPSGEPYRFEADGQTWWGGARRFPLAPGRELRIAVVVPESDLLGNVALLRWVILGIVGLALAVAAWRTLVLAGRFSGPIEELVAGSERIRKGDLEPGAPIRSDLLEVRRLADSQERMRAGLQTLLKLERDLQVARQIQQKTFPEVLPGIPGYDVEGWSEPADETGGDTYDVIGLQGAFTRASLVAGEEGAERAMLMLADATGHGIGPALSAMQLRAMLRMAVRLGAELEPTVRHMNEQLCQDLPAARFLTTWFGQLDPAHGTLRTFSAGQAPLLHLHAATDAIDVLQADAPPLGILPHLAIRLPDPVALEPGDLYVVLSDGIYEAMDPEGRTFGDERVQALLREHKARPPREILQRIREAVLAFARGRPADDDRTAVIVKRL